MPDIAMTNKELEFISRSIVETYVKRIDELKPRIIRHFLDRAYQATGSLELRKMLMEKGVAITKRGDLYNRYVWGYEELLNERVNKLQKKLQRQKLKINDAKKIEQLKSHPKLLLYHGLVWHLYYLQRLGIQEKINPDIPGVEQIKCELLSNSDFVKFAVVPATNINYLSKTLGIFDIEDEFIELFKVTFNEAEFLKDDIVFTNYVYGLTHIVIGASNFYRNKIEKAKYYWCVECFDRYSDLIFQRLSLDINTEVALCYKMLGITDNDYIQKVIKRLCGRFDNVDGYIHREKNNSFCSAEHTNTIALLLFNFENLLTRWGGS